MAGPKNRLFTRIVDDAARNDPERSFGKIPLGHEVSDGFQNLPMKTLARMVDSLAWWIESTIGPAEEQETLAYMAANDVRYVVFMLACQKTGYKAFFPSTRNSDDAYIHLLNATGCTKFVYTEERKDRVLEIQSLVPGLQIWDSPSIKTLLSDEKAKIYPYTESYEDAEDKVIVVIHSSGTTGMPKPVYLRNGFFMCMDGLDRLPVPKGRQPGAYYYYTNDKDLVLATTPFFHLMGIISFAMSIFHEVPMLIIPDKPLSVDLLTEAIAVGNPTAGMFPPSVLEDMSHNQKALAQIKKLRAVYYGGAPLAEETGHKLQEYAQVIPVLGTSEIGWIPTLVPQEPRDWHYFEFNPSYGLELKDIGEDLYELIIPRQQNSRQWQGIFHTFPDIDVYHTNDVYTRHPTHPNLYKFHGRLDDVIVLSNGEKFNPVTMETIIESHPWVQAAVVFGQNRFQSGLLIEPHPKVPEMDLKTFVKEIWPKVQTANHTVAAHGRVVKGNIIVSSKSKPFKRTPKGTVQRRMVLKDYETEIDAVYDGSDDENSSAPDVLDEAGVLAWTNKIISQTLEKEIPGDVDMYSFGLDSLMTMQVAKTLQQGVQKVRPDTPADTISSQTIYSHPTVEKLAHYLHSVIEGNIEAAVPREVSVENLVKKYTADLPKRTSVPKNGPKAATSVILTGSTGSLGTYLLNLLLNEKTVTKIYCLNRSDAEERQKKLLIEKGFEFNAQDWTAGKVEFLTTSFGEERFGLTQSKYDELLASVDTIIHNAWKVDFNNTVESFEETHIQGVRRFVDFSIASKNNAHIHFVSSISSVGGWSESRGSSVPEIPMEDVDVVMHQGYGESKHCAERICLEASRTSRVPTTVNRVGQVGGPTTVKGIWNRHEWLPTIVNSSQALGKIPTSCGSMPVDWVPVDILAQIMIDLVRTRHGDVSELPNKFFHLVNPTEVKWSSLIPPIQEKYKVEPVPFKQWLAELESIQSPTAEELQRLPALKLLDFYRGLGDEENGTMSVPLDVTKTKEASPTMRSLQPISPALMANWLQQWNF